MINVLRIALSALALVACTEAPKDAAVYTRPLAEWRATGIAAQTRPLPDGRTLQWPDADPVMCHAASSRGPIWSSCSLRFLRTDGRLIGFDIGYHPQAASAVFELEPGSYEGAFRIARGYPDQWPEQPDMVDPDSDKPYAGRVRGRLGGTVDGHRYWAGCWHHTDGYPFPYGCILAIDHGRNGSSYTDLEAGEPPGNGSYRLDRTKIERLVRMHVAIRNAFERR
ncbi:hypothetical protein [Sphingomonas sanxanigenens]|uniref:Uncharacterized protein n=1 Tax=Sphingomonas sanxanigenens DSM 19645 = NX02 TaxID=1123269 RepID=W0ALD9_9SPHN|nr:hypothetical protein [Sphingomonas sanxanigenens]AHE57118.1 hypothetical protein NX02_27670 [Sphingomonas sanxanigenens DSM 19645 = NX02]